MMNKGQGNTGRVKGFFTKRKVSVIACTTLLCFSVGYFWNTSNGTWLDTSTKASNTMSNNSQNLDDFHKTKLISNHILEDLLQTELPRMIYTKPQILKPSRSDVLMMTPWFAPIVWEGTYNSEILNEQYRQRNVTVGLTVFAIKKLIWPPVRCSNFSTLYINETQQIRIGSKEYQIHFENIEPIWEDRMKELKTEFVQDTGYVVFLKKFLETAETYFMVGHRVNYYIFTDRPEDVPKVALKDGRNVVVLQVQNYPRWQEISMRRMEMINYFSQQQFINEVSYLVCVDVDMRFNDQVGVEILSNLFGTLHPSFYAAERQSFTYERRPASQAYVPRDEGDFYYAGGFFGGTVMEVYKLTKKCHEAIMVDKHNGIEAIWQEESHLNKYFVYHKPTKILSPEYLWDDNLGRPEILKKRRFLAVPKNHAAIRNK